MSDLPDERVKGWINQESGLYIDFANVDEFLYFAAWSGTLTAFKEAYTALFGDENGAEAKYIEYKNKFDRVKLMRIVNTTKLSDGNSLRQFLLGRVTL